VAATGGEIAFARVHPAIGIARVGNSPDQYFLGPEVPGRPSEAGGRFKDRQGRMKRQAVRFRVYGFDAQGNVVQELTAADAAITWTVHLANKKASWFEFRGATAEAEAASTGTQLPLRNAQIENTPAEPSARDVLVIDPGPRSISGAGTSGDVYRFDSGTFMGIPVPLGELRTDEAGRLLVLGGFGTSGSSDATPVTDFANNDNWHDDTSDGPVTASVVLQGDRQVPVTGAWVLVAPADFAPAVSGLVSLYDLQTAVARGQGWLPAPGPVSFTDDVYPILSRIVGYRWVNDLARRGHGNGAGGDFLAPDRLRMLASNGAPAKAARERVFARLRNPDLTGPAALAQANLTFMPQLSGDQGFATNGEPATWFALLPHQYEVMRRWAEGDFTSDWTGPPTVPQSVAQVDLALQPAALDRASLENTVGGPFFPGIEMTYTSREASFFVEAYRLRPDLEPGDVTKRMAVPWQADFYECRERWWPAQRPDDVVTEAEYDSVVTALLDPGGTGGTDGQRGLPRDLLLGTEPWDRGLGDDPNAGLAAGDNDMVASWSLLGVLRPRRLPSDEVVLVEGERRPYFGMKDREYFHIMLNIESYPDFLPMARALTEKFLAAARALQASPQCPNDLRPFTYSTRVLRSRLEQIYTQAAQSADSFSIADSSLTRESVIERLVQMAPFNQLDGAWLRNIGRVGPIDEVRALLFRIWMDEVGDGDPKLNHANVYTDLLHKVEVYLEPVQSRAYVENETLVDSAFTSPLFQLVISEFSDDYFPEILGMTLYLEWPVVAVKSQVAAMEAFGIDPLFYSLHIGIDNPTSGHGAMARRALELYLDEIRASSGDQAVQDAWSRIWDGYVAFASTGGLGEDFRRRVQTPPSPGRKVYDMIRRKAHFGSQNHGTKQLGPNRINNWFADPRGFMQELVGSAYIVPGDPANSPFFELLRHTGPMFRVFSEEEIGLWEDWARSLATPGGGTPETDLGRLMAHMVDVLRSRQAGTGGHAANQLAGPDPGGSGQRVAKPVAWWFEQPVPAFLAALADPGNGWVTPGDASSSRFVTELATGDHPMARVLSGVAPGTAHRTWRTIAIEWINAGCPVPAPSRAPAAAPVPAPAVTEGLTSAADARRRAALVAGAGRRAAAVTDVAPGVPATAAAASASQDAAVVEAEPRIPLLNLFQNETWQTEYDHIPVYGNGALH
jgi:hypothetical protein